MEAIAAMRIELIKKYETYLEKVKIAERFCLYYKSNNGEWVK